MARRILLLDTTLADGIRADDITLSPLDQVRIALRLDELGVGLIEVDPGGVGARFLREARRVALRSARLLARARLPRLPTRGQLDRAKRYGAAGLVLHGTCAELPADLSIFATMRTMGLLPAVRLVDWFSVYAADPDEALAAVERATEAGAEWILLRDGQAAALPREVAEGVAAARRIAGDRLGIGASNDGGLAVASVLEGVGRGARVAEGVINGYGPRCGLADLVQVAANLSLRKRLDVLPDSRLKLLAPTARFVAELANHIPDRRAPFVGDAAFLCEKRNLTVDPRRLGARSRPPLEDPSGHSLLARIAKARGFRSNEARKLLEKLRALESRGFRFEGAEASFELALRRLEGQKPWFVVESYRCLTERVAGEKRVEATCLVRVGDQVEHTAASGDGPIHALDKALRKSLQRFYPGLRDMSLLDYKVRMLPGGKSGADATRVLAQSGDGRERWGTSGVSDDVLDASFLALVDAVSWKLHKDGVRPAA